MPACLFAADVWQSMVEPLFILAQANLLTGCRAAAEGSAALARGAATYGGLVWLGLDGALAFGLAQVLSASRPLYLFSRPRTKPSRECIHWCDWCRWCTAL